MNFKNCVLLHKYLILLFLLLKSSDCFGQNLTPLCASIFGDESTLTRHYHDNEVSHIEAVSLVPDSRRRGYLRLDVRKTSASLELNGSIAKHELVVQEFSFRPDENREAIQNIDSPASGNPPGTAIMSGLIERFKTVLLGTYSERRAEWVAEKGFIDKLKSDLIQHSEHTKFTLISNSQEDIGSIRTVFSWAKENSKLPMEEALSVEVEANAGLKAEVGSFTIDRRYNKQVFGELAVSMILDADWIIKRPDHEKDKNVFYTYAYGASLRMYTSAALQFKFVSGKEPIFYAGKKWFLLASSAENIMQIPSRLADARKQWEPEEAALYDDLAQRLRKFNWNSGINTKLGSNQYRPAFVRIFKHTSFLKFSDAEEAKPYRGFIIQVPIGDTGLKTRANDGLIEYFIGVPEELLPLKPGTFKINKELTISYYDGTLTIEKYWHGYGSKVYQVKTDSSLFTMNSGRIVFRNGANRVYLNMSFEP